MTSSDPSPTISPTGEQWAIAHGRQQVIVTEVEPVRALEAVMEGELERTEGPDLEQAALDHLERHRPEWEPRPGEAGAPPG